MCEKAALFDNAAYAEDAQELVENVLENLCEAWGMAPDGKDAGGGLKDGADGLLPDKE
jgi:hypothetical protein